MTDLDLIDALMIMLAGLAAGFINPIAGGGSLLVLPVLIFVGLEESLANGTNRLAILIQNFFAVRGFKSKGVSAWPYSGWLGLVALAGAIPGAFLAVDIKGETFNRILGVVMIIAIIATIFKPFGKTENLQERMGKKYKIIGYIAFFFVGLYGGFIQAGVGFIIIATLGFINRLSLVKTNATKVMVVFIYTFAALAVFLYNGKVNFIYGAVLATGNSIGAWVSSRWSVGAGEKWIKRFLIVTVSIMALKLWFPQLFTLAFWQN